MKKILIRPKVRISMHVAVGQETVYKYTTFSKRSNRTVTSVLQQKQSDCSKKLLISYLSDLCEINGSIIRTQLISKPEIDFTLGYRAVTRTLIGRGGCIFIYSCSARRVSFQIKFKFVNLKRNFPPPPINILVTSLLGYIDIFHCICYTEPL